MSMRAHIAMKSSSVHAQSLTPAPFGMLQRKCACGSSGTDQCPECSKKQGTILQRTAIGNQAEKRVPSIVHEVLRSPGQPLDTQTRAYFEARLGHDFSHVRIHTDTRSTESATAVSALAYTVGRHVVFGARQYAPGTRQGKKLLAHELAHVVQQRSREIGETRFISAPSDTGEQEAQRTAEFSGAEDITVSGKPGQQIRMYAERPTLQRDLMAYKTEHEELLPTFGESGWISYEVYTADAPNISNALKGLIMAKKVGTREMGDRTFFFSQGASHDELLSALSAVGYAKGKEMTDALLDQHNVSLYSREQVTKMSGLFTMTIGTQKQFLERQAERPLTNAERTEARLVFGNSLDFDQITVAEDPLMTVGGYARTLPHHIYFPPGSFGASDFMSLLIHELTHSWQYRYGVSKLKIIYHAIRGDYDYGYEAGLRAAQAAGKGFTSFSTEQQGDILRDYYRRLKTRQDVSAWLPFVNEVRGSVSTAPAPKPAPATVH